MKLNDEKKFWSKVIQTDDGTCWYWMAGRDKDGYGKFKFQGKFQSAHRMAWIFRHGEIPAGLHVLHKCDEPSCVSPSHLFLGTNQENMDDRTAKDRLPRGHNHPNAKLTDEQAKYARHLYFAERHTPDALAKFFGVSAYCIRGIVHGLRYRSQQWPPLAS